MKTLALIFSLAVLPAAWAQAPAALPCPPAAQVGQAQALGLWRVEFEGLQGATLLIEKHAEYAESISGAINRNGVRGLVAGDLEDGGLAMEESDDGVRISATWNGQVVEGSCGREIRGSWQAEDDSPPRKFVLRKLP